LTQSTTAVTDQPKAGIKETCQRFNDYDMERISKGELQDEIDYLKARAIREGRANE
jgi:hypothetical protein